MKSTKKAFLLSMVSMLLCVAMLMGTTFAWFTDSVTSGVNTITAGNLDIELEYSKNGTDWNLVQGTTELFSDVTLWEPGATSVVYLKLTNKGTLALKYNLAITATGGDFTNAAGQSKNLKDALKFAQVAGPNLTTYATRDLAVAATTSVALGLSDYAQANHMAANDVSYITLVVTMPTTVGNDFNYKTGTPAPEIQLGITLNATQYTAESDSFDKYYDVTATPIDVYTAEEFTKAVAQAKTGDTINVMTAGLDLTVEYTDTKTLTLRGEKINTLTANIPNGTIHVYNEVTTVVGTNVDLQNSAHFHNKIDTLNATAGHFVIEAGAVAGTINTPEEAVEKDLKVEIKGLVEEINVPKADTKVAVKVEEGATVTALNITDDTQDAKIVLQNFGTIGNEATVKAKTQFAADIAPDESVLTINNADEFKAFAKAVNGGNNYKNWTIKLGKDIDLKDVAWTPIGRGGKRFEGTFDGQNHTIKNLTSVLDSTSATMYGNGLFGDITGGAVLKNFVVDNANVYDKVDGKGNVYGIVCGYAYGTVTFENITVKNSKISAFGKVAAILGMAADPNNGTTTIKNCKVLDTEITGAYNCATFAGLTQNAVVYKSNSQSNVSFKYSLRYGAECYTDVVTAAASGDAVNGKYWKYQDDYYMAAWADMYNEMKETTINEGTVGIDAITHNITKINVVAGETAAQTNDNVKNAITSAKENDVVIIPSTVEVSTSVTVKEDITLSGEGVIKVGDTVALQVSGAEKTITVDGLTIESNKSKAVDLSDKSKLVIQDAKVERTDASSGSGFNQLILANDDAEITISGGEFTHTGAGNYATIVKFDDKGGKAELTGGNYKVGNTAGSHAKVVDLDSDVVGEVKIGGGDYTINGSHGAVVNGGKEGTTVTIDGGNFKVGNVGYLVYSSVAQVVVNDCTYVSDMTGATGSPKYSYIFNVSGTAKVTVKGGNFTLDKTADTVRICSNGQNANVILEGGTFNVQPSKSATIANGFHEVDNGNGTWTVVAD